MYRALWHRRCPTHRQRQRTHAGVIQAVNVEDERVVVNRTKEQIENSPEFDQDRYRDETYRSDVGTYYDEGGRGYRDW
jgi:hypothetical protein